MTKIQHSTDPKIEPPSRPEWATEILTRIDRIDLDLRAVIATQAEMKLAQMAMQHSQAEMKIAIEIFSKLNDGYQKSSERVALASDRVANLAFTVVTASAAVVVLAPVVRVTAELAGSYLLK
jgi:hypothetical protein